MHGIRVTSTVSNEIDPLRHCNLVAQHHGSAFKYAIKSGFVTEVRWPTILHFIAPAALPIKSKSSIEPVFAIGAVTANKASPAPIVSTTLLVLVGSLSKCDPSK